MRESGSWSRPPARSRRVLPAGFVEPCQPTLVQEPPGGPEWLHELKYDGYRLIARKESGRVRLWSRQALSWTSKLPRIVRGLETLPVTSVTLDGEAVLAGPGDRPDFDGLRSGYGLRSAMFIAFDLLEIDGEDLRELPLEERHERLRRVLPFSLDGLARTETFSDGPVFFQQVCAMGLEGIVSKRRDCPYRSGRSTTWLKVKRPEYRRCQATRETDPLSPRGIDPLEAQGGHCGSVAEAKFHPVGRAAGERDEDAGRR